MKIRIIRKPQYTQLHSVQVKSFWWPFWKTICDEDIKTCTVLVDDMMKHGQPYIIVREESIK